MRWSKSSHLWSQFPQQETPAFYCTAACNAIRLILHWTCSTLHCSELIVLRCTQHKVILSSAVFPNWKQRIWRSGEMAISTHWRSFSGYFSIYVEFVRMLASFNCSPSFVLAIFNSARSSLPLSRWIPCCWWNITLLLECILKYVEILKCSTEPVWMFTPKSPLWFLPVCRAAGMPI